jgi:multidrug efflux pump subunit AcrB
VRDKVSGAVGDLPLDAEPPIVQKFDINSQPMLWMALAGLDARELSDYADQVVKPRLQAVEGVGSVFVAGFREPMMRLWIDRDRLAAHRLAVNDVITALGRENLELPGGFIEGPMTELAVRNMGLFENVDDFNDLIVATVDGRPIRLSDVGFAQLGISDERGLGRYNLTPTLGLGIAPRAGANLVDVNRGARERMAELAGDFPEGLYYDIAFDGAEYVEKSIKNVQVDIIYGAVLAILVVFVFLRSWRSTFIVSLAIPTSLVATFGFMRIFGFSLNNLTTLALALSVGVVIDDAIIVLENIFRHQEEGASPFAAAHNGHPGDRPRRHGRHLLDRRRVHPGGLHEGHDRPVPVRVRDLGGGGDPDLAVRRPHPDPHAVLADPQGQTEARAPLRGPRGRLPRLERLLARAWTGCCATRPSP